MSEAPPLTSRLPRGWPRILLGIALFCLSAALALGSALLPYVTIGTQDKVFSVNGAEQTANLHLVLVIAGVLGAWMSLDYTLRARPQPVWFLTLGGIALVAAAFLTLDAHFTVSQGWIRDAEAYAALTRGGEGPRIGSALYVALACAVAVTLLGLVMVKLRRIEPPPETPARRARF